MRTLLPTTVLVVLFAMGCRPEIGDECVTSVDCSAQGDRLCDTSQPDGYCTIFGCEPDACPDNSVCVGFGQEIDPACANADVGTDPRWPRFERTFCMIACETNDDCRDGYVCALPTDRRAVAIDLENELRGSGVCFVASDAVFQPPADPPSSCTLDDDEAK
ncbi:MAG: hypothetical protein HOW73_50930 [Polyangiaceae bacterium]|nr:hypothetical protein [Polyangiaceae bacterium]